MLEIRTTGKYFFSQWTRNGDTNFDHLPNFFHFGEVYVAKSTSILDLGIYEVHLATAPSSGQDDPDPVQITVISPGM